MDPSTTLITFLLQTHPSVQSVQLIGSWDNFTSPYTMRRDSRRGRDQWKGCYSFRNDVLTNVDNSVTSAHYKNEGGLTMGQTYYYFYEINGSLETHDPMMPSTTTCPFLPGQTVNTLDVPMEKTLRQRSVSLSHLRSSDFMTKDPAVKFVAPRPPPPVPTRSPYSRAISEPSLREPCQPELEPLPGSLSWRRMLFRRLGSRECLDASPRTSELRKSLESASNQDLAGPPSSARGSSPKRDITPESLRRFLMEDSPAHAESVPSSSPDQVIADVSPEDGEDDLNFAASAVSETHPYATMLSPPPARRPDTSETAPLTVSNVSTLTLATIRPATKYQDSADPQSQKSARLSALPKLKIATRTEPVFTPDVSMLLSPRDDCFDEEASSTCDDLACETDDLASLGTSLSDHPLSVFPGDNGVFQGYKLPSQSHQDEVKGRHTSQVMAPTPCSPSSGPTSLLLAPIEGSLVDEFARDLHWIAGSIDNKAI